MYREDLDTLEAQCNAVLLARLPDDVVPRPQRVAIDLTLLPYYGRPAVEGGELRRGEAKAGTTRFHAYATAYLVRDGRRLTLARTYVRAEDELLFWLTGENEREILRLRVPAEIVKAQFPEQCRDTSFRMTIVRLWRRTRNRLTASAACLAPEQYMLSPHSGDAGRPFERPWANLKPRGFAVRR